MTTGRWELFRDTGGEYRFRLRAANGEIVLTSESYKSRASAAAGISVIRLESHRAVIVDLTTETRKEP